LLPTWLRLATKKAGESTQINSETQFAFIFNNKTNWDGMWKLSTSIVYCMNGWLYVCVCVECCIKKPTTHQQTVWNVEKEELPKERQRDQIKLVSKILTLPTSQVQPGIYNPTRKFPWKLGQEKKPRWWGHHNLNRCFTSFANPYILIFYSVCNVFENISLMKYHLLINRLMITFSSKKVFIHVSYVWECFCAYQIELSEKRHF